MDLLDAYLENNKNKQLQQRKDQVKKFQAKKQKDKEELEELLKKLKIYRELIEESILKTQMKRKEKK